RGLRGAERGHERAELAMPLDAPEALGGAQQAEPYPPPPHVAIAPALDVPRDVAQRADQILDAVRRREEAAQRRRQPQLQHRERFLQPLAHTGGGIGVTIPHQPRGQRRQLPFTSAFGSMPSLSSGNRIPVEDATTRVPLIIDRSKSQTGAAKFAPISLKV